MCLDHGWWREWTLHVNADNLHWASSDEEIEGLSGMLYLFEVIEVLVNCGPDIWVSSYNYIQGPQNIIIAW